MRFQVLSDEELEKKKVKLKVGICSFEILKAEDHKTEAGNESIKLIVKVYDIEGNEATVFEYIGQNAQWKLKQLLSSIGKNDLYKSGDINPSDLEGGSGKCLVYLNKDRSGQFKDSFKIKEYYPDETGSNKAPVKKAELPVPTPDDDDIPF